MIVTWKVMVTVSPAGSVPIWTLTVSPVSAAVLTAAGLGDAFAARGASTVSGAATRSASSSSTRSGASVFV